MTDAEQNSLTQRNEGEGGGPTFSDPYLRNRVQLIQNRKIDDSTQYKRDLNDEEVQTHDLDQIEIVEEEENSEISKDSKTISKDQTTNKGKKPSKYETLKTQKIKKNKYLKYIYPKNKGGAKKRKGEKLMKVDLHPQIPTEEEVNLTKKENKEFDKELFARSDPFRSPPKQYVDRMRRVLPSFEFTHIEEAKREKYDTKLLWPVNNILFPPIYEEREQQIPVNNRKLIEQMNEAIRLSECPNRDHHKDENKMVQKKVKRKVSKQYMRNFYQRLNHYPSVQEKKFYKHNDNDKDGHIINLKVKKEKNRIVIEKPSHPVKHIKKGFQNVSPIKYKRRNYSTNNSNQISSKRIQRQDLIIHSDHSSSGDDQLFYSSNKSKRKNSNRSLIQKNTSIQDSAYSNENDNKKHTNISQTKSNKESKEQSFRHTKSKETSSKKYSSTKEVINDDRHQSIENSSSLKRTRKGSFKNASSRKETQCINYIDDSNNAKSKMKTIKRKHSQKRSSSNDNDLSSDIENEIYTKMIIKSDKRRNSTSKNKNNTTAVRSKNTISKEIPKKYLNKDLTIYSDNSSSGEDYIPGKDKKNRKSNKKSRNNISKDINNDSIEKQNTSFEEYIKNTKKSVSNYKSISKQILKNKEANNEQKEPNESKQNSQVFNEEEELTSSNLSPLKSYKQKYNDDISDIVRKYSKYNINDQKTITETSQEQKIINTMSNGNEITKETTDNSSYYSQELAKSPKKLRENSVISKERNEAPKDELFSESSVENNILLGDTSSGITQKQDQNENETFSESSI